MPQTTSLTEPDHEAQAIAISQPSLSSQSAAFRQAASIADPGQAQGTASGCRHAQARSHMPRYAMARARGAPLATALSPTRPSPARDARHHRGPGAAVAGRPATVRIADGGAGNRAGQPALGFRPGSGRDASDRGSGAQPVGAQARAGPRQRGVALGPGPGLRVAGPAGALGGRPCPRGAGHAGATDRSGRRRRSRQRCADGAAAPGPLHAWVGPRRRRFTASGPGAGSGLAGAGSALGAKARPHRLVDALGRCRARWAATSKRAPMRACALAFALQGLAAFAAHAAAQPAPEPLSVHGLPAEPALSAILPSGSRLEWRHFDAAQDMAAVLAQAWGPESQSPALAVWPGHTLMVLENDACHVLLSLRPRPGGGTTGSQSRLCAPRPAASAGVEPLGQLAELLHAHAEDRVTVSVWSLPLADRAASRWLDSELQSRGWRPALSDGAWVRGDARLDTFWARLDAGATAASGLVLVHHHD
ncbi:hypothetical protein L541_0971 [Bordetella hinzii CA90 BAL1384]|nr:hypothetical protein L541_0971 [Bordetella hinzii CA90 BAL1384]KCB44143.1 hypothetical protein L539_1189 [Bordetella hinzii 5132]